MIDRMTCLPIYFRYIAGNIVDVTTLQTTLAEAKAFGIKIKHAILDAGYYSEKNIKALNDEKIPYIIHLKAGTAIFKSLYKEFRDSLGCAENAVKYHHRILYAKRKMINLHGTKVYAFFMLDMERRHADLLSYYQKNLPSELPSKLTSKLNTDKMNCDAKQLGIFVLLSANKLSTTEILHYYYQRQRIEQVFDIGINNIDLLPIRAHSEETFRGHLMLSFMSSTIYQIANNLLKGIKLSPSKAFYHFKMNHGKVFSSKIICEEPNKLMNIVLKELKLTFPTEIKRIEPKKITKVYS
jgi:transposase